MTQPTSNLPVVKQCHIEGHAQFGSSATANGQGRWLIANPVNGGHWATDDDVSDWATLPSPSIEPLPSPEPTPASATKAEPEPAKIGNGNIK
jgi:hypothetical protein